MTQGGGHKHTEGRIINSECSRRDGAATSELFSAHIGERLPPWETPVVSPERQDFRMLRRGCGLFADPEDIGARTASLEYLRNTPAAHFTCFPGRSLKSYLSPAGRARLASTRSVPRQYTMVIFRGNSPPALPGPEGLQNRRIAQPSSPGRAFKGWGRRELKSAWI